VPGSSSLRDRRLRPNQEGSTGRLLSVDARTHPARQQARRPHA
jgi:hypothetical protein